jgi:hypothetical protein
MTVAELRVTVTHHGPAEALVTLSGTVDAAGVGGVEHRLTRVIAAGSRSVLVDLSGVRWCDCRLLTALGRVNRRPCDPPARLRVRGLDPDTLTGFSSAQLPDVLAAYRASLDLQPDPDGEPAMARCSSDERRLAQLCVTLADRWAGDLTGLEAEDWLAARLVAHCVSRLDVAEAAVLLTDRHSVPRLAAASSETARILEWSSTEGGQGPGEDSARTGEPLTAPDLSEAARRPLFAAHADEHRLAAVFAVPMRHRDLTIGALDLFVAHPGPMARTDLDVARALAELVTMTILSTRRAHAPTAAPPVPRPRAGSGRARTDRITLDRATGVLAEREHITMAAAAAMIAARARTQRRRPADVAWDVIEATVPLEVADPAVVAGTVPLPR